MTTAATSLLGLALPVTGELSGTWGDTVNNSITSLLDTAIAGTTTLSTDGDVTLSTTTLAANQARQAILLCSGARTAIRTITAPAQSKIYTIINATTGGYAVKIVGAGPTTGLTIPNGASAVVAWNGSDFIEIGSSTIGNLTVNGNLTVTGTSTLTGAATLTANPTLSAGTANGVAYLNGSKVLTTGSALTFDGTNLGVGVTPSAWSGVGSVLQVGTSAVIIGNSVNSSSFISNAYYDGSNYKYIGTGYAVRLALTSGAYAFQTAASGTAGNAITFTQAMTLDASGNLGLGTTTPDVFGRGETRTFGLSSSGTTSIGINAATGNNPALYLGVNGTRTIQIIGNSSTPSISSGASLPLIFSTDFSERARIDTSGNFGIGTSSPAAKLDVNGTAILRVGPSGAQIGVSNDGQYYNNLKIWSQYSTSIPHHYWGQDLNGPFYSFSGSLRFLDNATERARIDSSGNLGVGTTSPSYKLTVQDTGNAYIVLQSGTAGYANLRFIVTSAAGIVGTEGAFPLVFRTSDAERARIDTSGNLLVGKTASAGNVVGCELLANGTIRSTRSGSNNTTSTMEVYSTGASANRFYVDMAGTIFATSTSITAISDESLKENIRDLDTGLAQVLALKPRRFDWKEKTHIDAKGVAGFIAQEVETVLPELVYDYKYNETETKKSLKMGDILPTLVKAIQEQQALIESLTARIAALEGAK